jgi:hypothetical protein
LLKEEVGKLTAAQKLSVKNDVIKAAEDLCEKTQAQLEEYKKIRLQIENRAKSAQSGQINTLISELKSPSPDIRAKASQKLAKLGDNITRDDFNKIVDVMYHGKDESRKKLYRQSHCTWYEYTQSRYYAAETLLAMKSEHVNEQSITDAKKAKANGRSKRKVTDPGWI